MAALNENKANSASQLKLELWLGLAICILYTFCSSQIKMAFAKFDSNGDDCLDYREFCQMIKEKAENQN